MSVADAVSAVLLPSGAAFCALGALGVLRFTNVLARLHAATKPQTIGLVLILIGAAVQTGSPAASATLLLTAVFQLLTVPVIAETIGAAAYHGGVVPPGSLVLDEGRDEGGDAGP